MKTIEKIPQYTTNMNNSICNCRTKYECSLNNNCLQTNVIYKVIVRSKKNQKKIAEGPLKKK